jgi:hypothetical protein
MTRSILFLRTDGIVVHDDQVWMEVLAAELPGRQRAAKEQAHAPSFSSPPGAYRLGSLVSHVYLVTLKRRIMSMR